MRVFLYFLIGMLVLPSVGLGYDQSPPNPLTVDDAVSIALRQNRAFLQAKASLIVARGGKRSALSALFPSVNGSANWNKSRSTNTIFDFPVRQLVNRDFTTTPLETAEIGLNSKFQGTTWGVGASQNISLQRWLGYRSSLADLDQAEFNVENAAQDLAFSVRQQFYLVLRAQDLLTVQKEDLRLAGDEEQRVTSMFDVGSVARADVMKAKVRVSEAELALIQQENAVEVEETRLAILLGYNADTDLGLKSNLSPQLQAVVDSSAAVAQALNRADLAAARHGLRSANLASKASKLYWLPTVFANFSWNETAGDSESDRVSSQPISANSDTLLVFPTPELSEISRDGWSVQVGASINLDAFLFWTGDQKQAKGFARQRQYQLEDLELQAQGELEEAILNLRASTRAIGSAQDGVVSAEEDLRLSQERYQQGLGTILELLESQVALTRARYQLVNALTGLRIAEAAYDKARGVNVY